MLAVHPSSKFGQNALIRSLFIFAALVELIVSCTAAMAQQPATLRLPPSLERELKLRGANVPRVVRFSDTVKADKLIAQSLRDTTGRELDSTMVRDSAIVVVDSAVSLSHKEWLDSMLAELPETERTPEGLRFHYPDRMMVTTARRQVPFDTTLPMRMDPVSKEDLPLFDELAMPKPIVASAMPRYSVRVGVGTPYLPSIDAEARLVNASRTSLDLAGSFIDRIATESPFGSEWSVRGHGVFTFPSDRIPFGDPVPMISAELGARSLSRDLVTDSGRMASSLMRTRLDGSFSLGTLSMLRATGEARLHYFTDNTGSGLTERSGGFDLTLEHQPTDSSNRIMVGLRYDGASGSPAALDATSAIGGLRVSAAIASKERSAIDWSAGASVISAADPAANTVYIYPELSVGKKLTNDLDLYATLRQDATPTSYDELASQNPFFAPLLGARDTSIRSLLLTDVRRATITKYAATLGANYFLSSDDYLHIAFQFGSRHNEVAFESRLDSGAVRYYPHAEDTRFFSVDMSAALLFFKNDRLTMSAHLASTRTASGDKQLPFVPIATADAKYTFGSLLERLLPSAGVQIISRSDANFLFVNVGADYRMSDTWSLQARLDNLLGNDGAYWVPYDEHLRTVMLSILGTL